ncbi:MAG: ATP-grasp fold amidoligase family protein [Nitrososphaerota archaeon]
MIVKIIKKMRYYYRSKTGHYILYIPKLIWKFILKILPDKIYIQIKYEDIFGFKPNLINPQRFTEKIQWLKLNDRRDIYTICADKYLVRNYVKEKIGSKHLIPLVFVTDNSLDITENNLPDYPVILKTNHDSGKNFVILNKKEVDFIKLRKELHKKMKRNHYYLNREWEYKNIKPKIIIEKLLKDDSGNTLLNDYKIHCFNGKPLFIQTIFDRGIETKEDWFDINWNPLDVYYFSPIKKHPKKPLLLNELLRVAQKLSEEFIYVRVDLYISNGQVYFGELTFRPAGGFMKFKPDFFDFELGKYLSLKYIKNEQ